MAVIAIDFDGVCVINSFPEVGKNIGASDVLKKLIDNGHKLILWTFRYNTYKVNEYGIKIIDVPYLNDAVKWFENSGIELYGVNMNPGQKNEKNHPYYGANKVYADIVLDYYTLGLPLKWDKSISGFPFADWKKIEQLFIDYKLI